LQNYPGKNLVSKPRTASKKRFLFNIAVIFGESQKYFSAYC